MKRITERSLWLNLLLLLLLPIVGMALGVGITGLLNIDQQQTGSLIINLFLLAACLGLIYVFEFTREDLGLKVIKEQMRRHIVISLAITGLYVLYYLFAIRISDLRPFSSSMTMGLVTFLVVVFAEELYFRGVLYGFVEKRFSARTALIVTAILFGLFHARQGTAVMVSRVFSGWLWGSVRYASGMIFLIIFPVHYTFNAVWLLFEGNWSDPPAWAIYSSPALELLLGLAIVIIHDRRLVRNR